MSLITFFVFPSWHGFLNSPSAPRWQNQKNQRIYEPLLGEKDEKKNGGKGRVNGFISDSDKRVVQGVY